MNPHTVYVRVRFPTSDYTVTRVQASEQLVNVFPPRYGVLLFVKECSAVPNHSRQYDSTFEYQFAGTGGGYPYYYDIGAAVFLDSNTSDPACGYRPQPLVTDAAGFSIRPATAIVGPAEQPSAIGLFPNPAHSIVSIHNAGGLTLRTLHLYNATGQLVLNKRCDSQGFSVAQLPAGLYTVVIQTDSGSVRQKLLIQH